MDEDKNIIMTSDPSDCPPWTDAQRDAQVEALRFAWMELVKALHRNGALDMNSIAIDAAEWQFYDNPETLQATNLYREALVYMRTKLGMPGADHES